MYEECKTTRNRVAYAFATTLKNLAPCGKTRKQFIKISLVMPPQGKDFVIFHFSPFSNPFPFHTSSFLCKILLNFQVIISRSIDHIKTSEDFFKSCLGEGIAGGPFPLKKENPFSRHVIL